MPNSTERPGLSPLAAALTAALLAAAASLLAPFEPLYDPWAWLIWGRELADLALDTSVGPSWKPLPSLIAAPLSLAGSGAPELWLVLARFGWFAAPVLAAALAARLAQAPGAPAVLAALLAAAGVVLLADGFTSWPRQAAGGFAEPLLVALALGAILAGAERRAGLALVLAALACLIRPEAWPFALLYGWREMRAGRLVASVLVSGAAAVLLLWFGIDLLGAGNPLEGAERARGADNSPLEALGWALGMPLAALWAGTGALLWAEYREGRDTAAWIAAGALAWIALVAAMSVVGYAGLPRFMAPAIGVVCALGGAGLVRLVVLPELRRAALPLGVLLAVAVAGQGAVRVATGLEELNRAHAEGERTRDLLDFATAERDTFVACGEPWVGDFVAQTPLAWALERPIAGVTTTLTVPPPSGRLLVGPDSAPGLKARMVSRGTLVAEHGEWRLYATGACATTEGGSGARR